MVPGFTSLTEIELPVPCTYDLEVASARYLHGPRRRHGPAAAAVQRHGVHRPRRGVQRRADPVELRGLLPDAGERLAGRGERALPRQRLAAVHQGDPRRAVRVQGRARAADLGRHAVRAARRRRPTRRARHATSRAGGAGRHERRRGAPHRRRGALRGLHPLPVPGVRAEEPQPLAVRRARCRPATSRPTRQRTRCRRRSASSSTPASLRGRGRRPLPAGPAAAPRARPLTVRPARPRPTPPSPSSAWDEAVEQEVTRHRGQARRSCSATAPYQLRRSPAARSAETACPGAHVVRRREPLAGSVRGARDPLPGPWQAARLTVRVTNESDSGARSARLDQGRGAAVRPGRGPHDHHGLRRRRSSR